MAMDDNKSPVFQSRLAPRADDSVILDHATELGVAPFNMSRMHANREQSSLCSLRVRAVGSEHPNGTRTSLSLLPENHHPNTGQVLFGGVRGQRPFPSMFEEPQILQDASNHDDAASISFQQHPSTFPVEMLPPSTHFNISPTSVSSLVDVDSLHADSLGPLSAYHSHGSNRRASPLIADEGSCPPRFFSAQPPNAMQPTALQPLEGSARRDDGRSFLIPSCHDGNMPPSPTPSFDNATSFEVASYLHSWGF
jgi:hypothetical protein